MIRIPKALYERLINHLKTLDTEEAKTLLDDLETQAKPAYITPSGSQILDYDAGAKYRVD
jgi:uncharacterized protein YpbB